MSPITAETLSKVKQFSLPLLLKLLMDHGEDDHGPTINKLLRNPYVLMFGVPKQVEAAVQGFAPAKGDIGELHRLFEKEILNPAMEEGFDPAYIQRRFQTMAKSQRLRDMADGERATLIKQDLEAFRLLSADENNEEFLKVLRPWMEIQASKYPSYVLLSQSSSPIVATSSSSSLTNGLRRRKLASEKE